MTQFKMPRSSRFGKRKGASLSFSWPGYLTRCFCTCRDAARYGCRHCADLDAVEVTPAPPLKMPEITRLENAPRMLFSLAWAAHLACGPGALLGALFSSDDAATADGAAPHP